MRFDLDRLEVTSDPVPVVDTVNRKGGAANFDVADNQSLVYIRGQVAQGEAPTSLVWVDREGNEEPLAAQPRRYDALRISPGGNRVAIQVREGSTSVGIHIYDTARNNLTQLTPVSGFECCPVWMPDGERIVFASARDGNVNLYVMNADGTGDAERLTEGATAKFPEAVTADGLTVVLNSENDLHTLSMGGDRTTNSLVETGFLEGRPRLSPDGRWIAYQTDESGSLEVLVRPFPEIEAGRWEATTGGGISPVWSPDGRELFFFLAGAMWAVPIETEPTFRALSPALLFQGPYVAAPLGRAPFDVDPDGGRFLMRRPAGPTPANDAAELELIVVQNWFEELERLVPAN